MKIYKLIKKTFGKVMIFTERLSILGFIYYNGVKGNFVVFKFSNNTFSLKMLYISWITLG